MSLHGIINKNLRQSHEQEPVANQINRVMTEFMDAPFGDIVVAPDCKTRHMRFIYGYVSSQL